MRVKLFIGIASAFGLAMTATAQDCDFKDGGYCLTAIAKQTAGVAKEDVPSLQGTGGAYLSFYEKLWEGLIQDGLANPAERDFAFVEAAQAGGTKIGGYNLVVLASRTLQHLVDKSLLTQEEAQAILEQSRNGGL